MKNASLIEVGDPLVPEATHYPTRRRRKTTQILSFPPRVLEMFWQKMNLEFDFNLSLGVLVISANFSLTANSAHVWMCIFTCALRWGLSHGRRHFDCTASMGKS